MQINNARREIIERNRVRLRAIVGAIITCGRQNIPLRGHRDDSQYYINNDKENPGNFIKILKYGASCGDLMDEVFKDCPSNQTYRSKTIQNEILEICGEMITEILVGEVKHAKFFSVLADEATDCSNNEQMANSPKVGRWFIPDTRGIPWFCCLSKRSVWRSFGKGNY